MLEGDHVDPRRIFLERALVRDVGVEAREELGVELLEEQVAAVVLVVDEIFEVDADAPIFIVSGHAAVEPHHAAELGVVAPEEVEQPLVAVVEPQIDLLDPLRRDVELLARQRVVAALDAVADGGQPLVDALGLGAAPRDPSRPHVPSLLLHRELRRELDPPAVDRDPAHDRQLAVAQRRASLHVEEDFECVSHSLITFF